MGVFVPVRMCLADFFECFSRFIVQPDAQELARRRIAGEQSRVFSKVGTLVDSGDSGDSNVLR